MYKGLNETKIKPLNRKRGWVARVVFTYKSFLFSAAVEIATFEVYCWKFTGYPNLMRPFISSNKIFQKWTEFVKSWSRDQLYKRLIVTTLVSKEENPVIKYLLDRESANFFSKHL